MGTLRELETHPHGSGRDGSTTEPARGAVVIPATGPAADRSPQRRPTNAPSIIADALAFAACLEIGHLAGALGGISVGWLVLACGGFAVAGISVAGGYGEYLQDGWRADRSVVDEIPRMLHVALVLVWLFALGCWAFSSPPRVAPLLIMLPSLVVIPVAARVAARGLRPRRLATRQSTIIVGSGAIGQLLAHKLIERPIHGLRLIGFVDDDPMAQDFRVADVPCLGRVEELADIISRHQVSRVLVAFSLQSHERTLGLLNSLRDVDVQVDVVPRLFDVIGPNARIHTIDGLPLIARPRANTSRSSPVIKRILDLVIASVGLLLLWPLFMLITLLVRLDSPGPAIYRADRVGRDGRPFTQLKFRTMKRAFCGGPRYGGEQAETAFATLLAEHAHLREQYERTHKLDPDPRVTRVGRFLRASSLDELPQLLNVMRGDLSLVGPRPVTTEELSRYGDGTLQLLSVRPGLTGYWQISGRSALSYEERVRLDLAYVASWSLKLDLDIFLKTFYIYTARVRAV